jgi:TPR repeat protein
MQFLTTGMSQRDPEAMFLYASNAVVMEQAENPHKFSDPGYRKAVQDKVISSLEFAAKNGIGEAFVALSNYYAEGIEVSKNLEKAAAYLYALERMSDDQSVRSAYHEMFKQLSESERWKMEQYAAELMSSCCRRQ